MTQGQAPQIQTTWKDRGSPAVAVRRHGGGRACDHADAPVPARDEPAEITR